MTECPQCHRHLLSQASPKCNWCGCEITDPTYQQNAAAERQAYYVHEAIHDAASLARIEAISVMDPLLAPLDPFIDPFTGLPLGAMSPFPARRMLRTPTPPTGQGSVPAFGHVYGSSFPETSPEPTPTGDEPSEEAVPAERFRHLEL